MDLIWKMIRWANNNMEHDTAIFFFFFFTFVYTIVISIVAM